MGDNITIKILTEFSVVTTHMLSMFLSFHYGQGKIIMDWLEFTSKPLGATVLALVVFFDGSGWESHPTSSFSNSLVCFKQYFLEPTFYPIDPTDENVKQYLQG